MKESQKVTELRQKLEQQIHPTAESLIKAVATRHTILNLGQNWPEVSRLEQLAESDEEYEGVLEEYKSWLKAARKEVNAIVKAKLPLTMANAEDVFMRRGPFAESK